jgi:hypothetical protein
VSVLNNSQKGIGGESDGGGIKSKSGLRFGLLCKPCSKRQERGEPLNAAINHRNAHNNATTTNTHTNMNSYDCSTSDVKLEAPLPPSHRVISSSTTSLNIDPSHYVEDADVIEINLSGSNNNSNNNNKTNVTNNRNAISDNKVKRNKNKTKNNANSITSDEEEGEEEDDDEEDGDNDDEDDDTEYLNKNSIITIVHDKLPASNKISNLKNSSTLASKRSNAAYHYQSLDEVTMANTRVNGIRKTRFKDEVSDDADAESMSSNSNVLKINNGIKIMEFDASESCVKSEHVSALYIYIYGKIYF